MYFKGLTFIFSEDPPENHLMVIGGLLLKYYVLCIIVIIIIIIINVEHTPETALSLVALARDFLPPS